VNIHLCALPRCSSGDYAAADSLLCEPCIEWVVATLRDTEKCIGLLSLVKAVQPGGGVNPNAGYESQSPAADHVLVMLDPRSKANGVGRTLTGPDDDPDPMLSVAVLGEWADLAGWSVGRRSVRDAVSALLVNHRWITSQTWVCDYVDELTRLHRQAAAAIGDGPPAPVASCTRVIHGEVCAGGVVVWHRIDDDGHHGAGGARCLSCRKPYAGPELVRLRLAQKEAG
jgi:hypothetical protein